MTRPQFNASKAQPGDRFLIYGGRVAHVVRSVDEGTTYPYGTAKSTATAECGAQSVWLHVASHEQHLTHYAGRPADESTPTCKACERARPSLLGQR